MSTEQQSCITYQIDQANRIVTVCDQWSLFASSNKADFLDSNAVLGKSLFGFITGGEVQHLHQMLIERSRKAEDILKYSFRCDSPGKRRFMSMQLIPIKQDSIEFRSCIVREEVREPVLLLDADIDRSSEFLKICSWCKKIEIDNQWFEVEAAIERLDLFSNQLLPQLTHGICPNCSENILSGLAKS